MPAPSSFSRRIGQMPYLALALALTAAGCSKGAPSGQTAATVNGEAITLSELNFELGFSGAPVANWQAIRPQVLQTLINRKLLIQAAKRDGVDKQPEVVLAQKRAEDMVIAERALQSATASFQQPATGTQVEAYLAKHPGLGSARRILSVEQVRFPVPSDAAVTAALTPAKTMAELVQVLSDRGIMFQRGATEIDSASIDDKTRNQLMRSASGEPVIVFDGSAAIANHVTGVRPVPASASATLNLAKQRLTADRVEAGIRQRQASLRNDAKIEYAKEFAPKSSSPAAN